MASNSASTPRPSFRRPTILVGSDTTMLGRPIVGADAAAGAGLYGVDLDLHRGQRLPSVGRGHHAVAVGRGAETVTHVVVEHVGPKRPERRFGGEGGNVAALLECPLLTGRTVRGPSPAFQTEFVSRRRFTVPSSFTTSVDVIASADITEVSPPQFGGRV